MMLRDNILTLLILLPAVGSAAVALCASRRTARTLCLVVSLATLGLSLLLIPQFDWNAAGPYAYAGSEPGQHPAGVMQMARSCEWIPAFNIRYSVGVDGLSLPMVLLTTVIFTLACVASWNVQKMTRGYLALFLLLEAGVLGTFLATDFFLFYVFFEVSLLPMYFLIGIWGGPRKEYAAIKFFLYTLVGSIGLLVVLIGVHLLSRQVYAGGTFDLMGLSSEPMRQLLARPENLSIARLFFVLAMVAFLVKIPAVPLHTWLPDAHVEAPTPMSMILAAVLLKMGGYGIFRIAYPLFPEAGRAFWLAVAIVGVVSILYGALCALSQTDFKRLVAYSSVSHMGFVVLGAAMMTPTSVNGAIFMMVAHGITSAMLFFVVGVIYDRLHHRQLTRMGGLATSMPVYTGFATVAVFANLGLPGLCGFVGEFMVLLGSFQSARAGSAVLSAGGQPATVYLLAGLACAGVVLSAAYNLWAMQKVFLGKARVEYGRLPEVTTQEVTVLTPLAILCVLLGVMPAVFVFVFTDRTVDALIKVLSS